MVPRMLRLPMNPRISRQLNSSVTAWVNESAEIAKEARETMGGRQSSNPMGMRHRGSARTAQNIIRT